MRFRLVVEKNGKRARVVEINTPTARIGRARGNEVRIPSAQVSRRHCQFRVEDGVVKVEDLESVNGTYLNGDLVTGEAVIRPGDRLEVGPVAFVVEYELTPEALERLREMDADVAAEADSVPDFVDEAEDVEPAAEIEEEEVIDAEAAEDEEILDVEEAAEEDNAPKLDLDAVTWAPPDDGDMRDLLSHLDEGQESMMPRKRPGPRRREPATDDWQDPRRGDESPSKPNDKSKRRKAEE